MGSNKYSDEKPIHEVTLTKPFEMQKTEVTQFQYELIMGSNPSYFKNKKTVWKDKVKGVNDAYNRPVDSVSYSKVLAFIEKLNTEVDTTEKCVYTYRLPTEAEWEYAAGENPTPLEKYAWYNPGGMERPYPNIRTGDVAQKRENNFGLYDMLGNVFEWVNDYYDERYYSSQNKFVDPQGPRWNEYKVIRGGSWFFNEVASSVSNRGKASPEYPTSDYGFRLVREPGKKVTLSCFK